MTYAMSPATRDVLAFLEDVANGAIGTSVLNWGSLRGSGISTPDDESHRLTVAPANPADPREGRGVVVRGSDE